MLCYISFQEKSNLILFVLQSYGRAIELEDNRVFARVESGNTFIMLGSFRKVIFTNTISAGALCCLLLF